MRIEVLTIAVFVLRRQVLLQQLRDKRKLIIEPHLIERQSYTKERATEPLIDAHSLAHANRKTTFTRIRSARRQ
ncbi:hypothetical protein BJ546DRAFT_359278 [Cryomyces antarcticus]